MARGVEDSRQDDFAVGGGGDFQRSGVLHECVSYRFFRVRFFPMVFISSSRTSRRWKLPSQNWRYFSSQPVAFLSGLASRRRGRRWASWPREIRPARSSTLRCLEMAGWDMEKGLASSFTEASPEARRARMARRVGSARAAKVASSCSEELITIWFYNHLIMHRTGAGVKALFRRR